ncbi:MAG TPA: CHAT domain-containing tetratricopeptide repeat protein [Cyclobacteriaceae bacterium]|nr:CHAT domain-containing tetratricopeptide repeat protein [Cyclobacteriaceae bacterium]
MKNHILLLSIFFTFYCRISQGQALVRYLDSMIMDSQYTRVISTVNNSLGSVTSIKDKIILENRKAESLTGLGEFEEAGALLDQILQECHDNKNLSPFYQAITIANMGFLNLNKGRNDLAEQEIAESLKIFEETGTMHSLDAAKVLNNLGLVYMNTGKYNQAEEYMLSALNIRKEFASTMPELTAASYNDLGLVYSQIDDNKAIRFYDQALGLYKEIHGESHPKIAIVTTNIAILYRKLKRNNEAISFFESALKIWEGVYEGPHSNKAFVLFNIGQAYDNIKAVNLALDHYDRALNMYHEVYGNKHPQIAAVYNAMGNLRLAQGDYSASLRLFQSAMKANLTDFNSDDIRSNPHIVNYLNGNVLLYSLLYKAEALEQEYFGKTLRFSNLRLALNALVLCDSLIDRLRQHSQNESDKIALGSVSSNIYSAGIRISAAAAENALSKRSYQELAFFFAEKSKAAVLQEAISDTNAKAYAGIPSEMLEEEKSLKSELATLSRKIAQSAGDQGQARLRETAFILNRKYSDFIKGLEKEYPEYFNLKYNSTAPSIADLQAVLEPSTAALSYFIDQDNERLYIFYISKYRFRIFQKPLAVETDRMITGLRNSLYYDEIMSVMMTAGYLYKELIPPIPAGVKKLIIIPADRLCVLPFETLVSEKYREGGYGNAAFLIKKYSVQYEFSAGLLLQKSKMDPNHIQSIFLCAPVTFQASGSLADLPGTETEVNTISELFSTKHLTASIYTGRNAKESEIKSGEIKNYGYLHLATHGVVDESNPELSRIYFSPSLPEDDGMLYTGEIYNLRLDARLVTLSACKTGLGKITRGEGVIGLSRALIYAGSRNIMVSFWNVADLSTAQLMKDFYGYQIDQPGSGFSDNLRLAKLNLLMSKEYSAPYYWAPFILIGF